MSLDNGKTFEEIATSNNGIFEDTDTWESVMIELPNLSGNPDTVYFAFRFTSDTYVEDGISMILKLLLLREQILFTLFPGRVFYLAQVTQRRCLLL